MVDWQGYSSAMCCGLQVLYDLGMVSHKEPFQRLVSQGMILGELEYVAMQQSDGSYSQDSQEPGTPVRSVQELCSSVYVTAEEPCLLCALTCYPVMVGSL